MQHLHILNDSCLSRSAALCSTERLGKLYIDVHRSLGSTPGYDCRFVHHAVYPPCSICSVGVRWYVARVLHHSGKCSGLSYRLAVVLVNPFSLTVG